MKNWKLIYIIVGVGIVCGIVNLFIPDQNQTISGCIGYAFAVLGYTGCYMYEKKSKSLKTDYDIAQMRMKDCFKLNRGLPLIRVFYDSFTTDEPEEFCVACFKDFIDELNTKEHVRVFKPLDNKSDYLTTHMILTSSIVRIDEVGRLGVDGIEYNSTERNKWL